MIQKTSNRAYVATVTMVFQLHVVTKVESIQGEVTFSLEIHEGVWRDEGLPTKGIKVVLADLRIKGNKWRAHKARFYRPEDESQPELKF